MPGIKRWLIYRAVRFGYNFVRSPDFRSVVLLRWRKPENLFQPFSDTLPDRYPGLFAFAQDKLGNNAGRRILSFGCSTGDEVFTLRQYFPLATIKGIDINFRSIRIARSRLAKSGDDRISFGVAASVEAEQPGSYDAIFCMAVFRHGGLGVSGVENRCDHLIRFEQFERTVNELARCLRDDGLLFIGHSNFRFCDTSVAKEFDVVYRGDASADPRTPIFDPSNRFLPDTGYGEVGFRKRRAMSESAPASR